MEQRSIQTPMYARGKGAVSGEYVRLTIRPAKAHHGIVFSRMDLPGEPEIKVSPECARLRNDCIDLTSKLATVYGVEPLLAALYGLGIDNVRVEVEGAELPEMANGVAAYVFLLQAAGVTRFAQQRDVIRITEPLLVRDPAGWARFYPYDGFRISLHETHSSGLDQSSRVVDFSEAVFVSDLCFTDQVADKIEALNALNQRAKVNIQRHYSHLQLNGRIVKFLALCGLTGSQIKGLYVKFGQSMDADLETIKSLYRGIRPFEDGFSEEIGRKVAFIG